VQAGDELRNLGARGDRGDHVRTMAFAPQQVPVEHHVLDLEGQRVLHLEGDRLCQPPALRERQGQPPDRDPITPDGRDHVVRGEPMHVNEPLHQLRQRQVALAGHGLDLHRLAGAEPLLDLHRLHGVASQVEPEDVREDGHPQPLLEDAPG
jgi:hypothetical protein